jgi:hypothetical protein
MEFGEGFAREAVLLAEAIDESRLKGLFMGTFSQSKDTQSLAPI